MRIAHVSDCYLPRIGGIEVQVHDLAQRHVAAGHDVTVITTTAAGTAGAAGAAGAAAAATALGPSPVVHRRARRRAQSGTICYWQTPAALRLLRNGKFDVVHVHSSTVSPLAFLAARAAVRQGVPTVATLHSLWASASPLFRMGDRVTRFGNWPVAWSAVSPVAAAPLGRLLGDRAEVAILANGIDPEYWSVEPAARDSDRTPQEGIRVVAVMRLAPRKRPLQLLRVLHEARLRLPPSVRFTAEIVGDGHERQHMDQFIRDHGMHHWVELTGSLPRHEIRAAYARADVFVAAATLESFGIAALEARCAGLPVVARHGTGIGELVVDGQDGLLAHSDDEMVDALVLLATAPEVRRKLAGRGWQPPRGVTWEQVLGQCDLLYDEAATLAGRGRTKPRRARQPGLDTAAR